MRLRLVLAAIVVLCLSACTGGRPDQAARPGVGTNALPPMKMFDKDMVTRPLRTNAAMANDFIDLSFRMESGRVLPRLTRFEGPVTLALTGAVPATATVDADRLIARLRREAGIDITRSADPAVAQVVVDFVPAARLRATVPQAACFVVPNVTDWADYLRARRTDRMDWARFDARRRTTVFIPTDTSPQEIRDCLHEEVAQALGPLNDLYRLSDSVFNDDNFHTVLTGFDMLMLRTTYDRALRSGMDEASVAARLPAILNRLNPRGRRGKAPSPEPTPRAWIAATKATIGPFGSPARRREAAREALAIARNQGWQDARMAFSQFNQARAAMPVDVEAGVIGLLNARRLYDRLPDAGVHAAHVDMQLAAIALAGGDAGEALSLVERRIPDARRAENAALLATLLMMKAEALAEMGRDGEALAARLDSLGWARYGFGGDDLVRARLVEVDGLVPRVVRAPGRGGQG